MRTKTLLMCIKDVRDDYGVTHARKGSTYTLADRAKCHCGVRDFLTTTEVTHPLTSGCIDGKDWLPAHHFVELNDPEAKLENEDIGEKKRETTDTIH